MLNIGGSRVAVVGVERRLISADDFRTGMRQTLGQAVNERCIACAVLCSIAPDAVLLEREE